MAIAFLDERLDAVHKDFVPWGRRLQSIDEEYELGDVLGKGTFSVVRRGRKHNGDATEYAVKEVGKTGLVDNHRKVRQLLVEIAVSKGLTHPHLGKTRDVVNTNQAVYLVMDLAPGSSLEAILQHNPSLPHSDAQYITRQLLSALAFLHAHRIVHRDVKPANMIIDRSARHVTLVDFGLSKHIGGRSSFSAAESLLYSPLTGSGQVPPSPLDDATCCATPEAGTALYLALEGLIGVKECNDKDLDSWKSTRSKLFKLDIYAAGAVAFRMLVGRLPYNVARGRLNELRQLMKLCPAKVPPSAEVPSEAVELVERMLLHHPELRPTAEEALRYAWLSQNDEEASEDGCKSPREEVSVSDALSTDGGTWDDLMQVMEESDEMPYVARADAIPPMRLPGGNTPDHPLMRKASTLSDLYATNSDLMNQRTPVHADGC